MEIIYLLLKNNKINNAYIYFLNMFAYNHFVLVCSCVYVYTIHNDYNKYDYF